MSRIFFMRLREFNPNLINEIEKLKRGDYLGEYENYYFSFDVIPNRSETEIRAMVNTALSDLYNNKNFLIVKTGMYAIYNG